MWEFRQNCCPVQEGSRTLCSQLRRGWGKGRGCCRESTAQGSLLVPFSLHIPALAGAAVCIPTVGISCFSLNYLLLWCAWVLEWAWIQLSKPGWGYCPQISGKEDGSYSAQLSWDSINLHLKYPSIPLRSNSFLWANWKVAALVNTSMVISKQLSN